MPHDTDCSFSCLACGAPTDTGAFCSAECEAHPDADARLTAETRGVLLEAMAWDAYRKALRTGIWH